MLPDAPASRSQIPFQQGLKAACQPERFRMLWALQGEEWRMVLEVAQRIGRDRVTVSRHMSVLRKVGLLEVSRAGLYRIRPEFQPDRSQAVLQLGFATLYLDAAAPKSAKV